MAEWIESERFAAYAEMDLDRWRQLEGQAVIPKSADWGEGCVERAVWETLGKDVSAFVQLKIQYAEGLAVRVNAATFAAHHQRVTVPEDIASFIEQWFNEDVDPIERAVALESHGRALRERLDRQRLERVQARSQGAGAQQNEMD